MLKSKTATRSIWVASRESDCVTFTAKKCTCGRGVRGLKTASLAASNRKRSRQKTNERGLGGDGSLRLAQVPV